MKDNKSTNINWYPGHMLKTKKQINEAGKEYVPEWQKSSKAFVYEGGGEIVVEPVNGVFKDGQKTVIEYIKVE